jgi:hypothetical protein
LALASNANLDRISFLKTQEFTLFVNQFAEKVWVSVNVQPGGAREVLLMVETELPLNPQQVNFDHANYNEFTAAVDAFISVSNHFDRAIIIPFNKSKSESSGWKVKFENPLDMCHKTKSPVTYGGEVERQLGSGEPEHRGAMPGSKLPRFQSVSSSAIPD